MEILGIGDRIAAKVKKTRKAVADTATGTSTTRTPTGVRTTRLGSESVRLTAAQRRRLPANQTTPKKNSRS